MYAKIENGSVVKYPYTFEELGADNPNVSFGAILDDATLSAFNAARVVVTGQPAHNPITQSAVEINPVYSQERNRWEQQWQVVDLSPEQAAANQEAANKELEANIVQATQERLDVFARTRNYDGILSACTYATSPTAKFSHEGQYCVEARDATWAKLYAMLAEVEAGTRPRPSGFRDVEPELPQLAWPSQPA